MKGDRIGQMRQQVRDLEGEITSLLEEGMDDLKTRLIEQLRGLKYGLHVLDASGYGCPSLLLVEMPGVGRVNLTIKFVGTEYAIKTGGCVAEMGSTSLPEGLVRARKFATFTENLHRVLSEICKVE